MSASPSTAAGAVPAAAVEMDGVEAIMRHAGQQLRERMARSELHLERVTASAGAPLASHASATIRAGGKRLRPLLVLVAAESAGGPPRTQAGEDRLVRAAVAVELVHSATLVHDDLIDGAQLRRGHPTVAAVAGRDVAVATGDLLFSLAFAELARNDSATQLRALSDASSALAEGELLQREDAYAAHVPLQRYLRRCELKTAALFEAACRLGALTAAAGTHALADALGAFARRIGLAFQMLDDVLDVSGPVERTGKSRGTDLLVKDLNSTNGTFINGEKVVEAVLKPGQILRLGQVEMRLESGAAAAAAGSAASKKPLEKTMVIGIKAQDLEQGARPVNFEANAAFSKKSNKANKIFIGIGIALGILIIAFLIIAFNKMQ